MSVVIIRTYTCDRCGKTETVGRDSESRRTKWPLDWCWIESDRAPICFGHACPECAEKMKRVGTEFVVDHPAPRPRLALVPDAA